MYKQGRRRSGWASGIAGLTLLTGCQSSPEAPSAADPSNGESPAAGSPSDPGGQPPEPTESSSAPTPDDQLTDRQLRALLETTASVRQAPGMCTAYHVEAQLMGNDAASGHRYSSLVVRNTSQRTCVVQETPGVGGRGTSGERLDLEVGKGTPEDSYPYQGPVRLGPGDAAWARIEWTGNLPGSGSERASLLVFQLAKGQVPVSVEARRAEDPPGEYVDIGSGTTVKVGRFLPRDF